MNNTNPFEDDNAIYHVLMNSEGQYSLWPAFSPVPEGWDQVLSDSSRADALAYVEKNWTDMRPNSLIRSTDG
ncbi:MbtH family protein [Actinomyces israelii]|uniref:MbtH family protein n=1 Tax=Actinomyces israelii TaxID=1659 RepID=A0ABT4IAT9_9ACTO|nr:MbtH family protein [Actinomyces israelii]MCZ0858868.1 MbtH family protein [Actinomyces israelii]